MITQIAACISIFLGKGRVILNWLRAVTMWDLTLGKESWKYSPALWFERARRVALRRGCFACSERVLRKRC